MGKSSKGLKVLSAITALAGGGILASDYLYRLSCKPRKFDEDKRDPRTAEGRRFVRNYPGKQDIYINAVDNLRLHAFFLPADAEKEDGTHIHDYVISIHGIWDGGDGMGYFAQKFLSWGMNVLLPDLRGHGMSEGRYIGYGYDDRLDIVEWIYWILKKDRDARIILHGISMGAATVLMTTGEHLPDNVKLAIEDSAYSTAQEEFEDVYESQVKAAVLPKPLAIAMVRAAIYLRAGYDIRKAAPIEAVKRSKTPTLFLHGDADTFIDPRMCAELYEAAACEKRYALILGADHVEGGFIDPATYWSKIESFIKEYL